MAKEKAERNNTEKEICISVFKNGILTKEKYTSIWIDLISTSEREKDADFSPKL